MLPLYYGLLSQLGHYNDNDVLAPNNISTAFLATIFYPTKQAPEGKPKPYLNPETAAFYESSYNYTPGVLASLTSNIQEDAPFLRQGDLRGIASFPTLLYGPGGAGPPTEGSTILLSELASYGYTVVGLDHPFEQPFLKFPNGTKVFGVDFDEDSVDIVGGIYNTRLVDNAAFLQQFPDLVRKLDAPFNVDHFGLLGYSFGGAATLGTTLEEEKKFHLGAALNIDGPLWGRVTGNSSDVDLHKPVLLLGEEQLIPPAWSTFSSWQTGPYFRKILINGSLHHDFSDDTFWKTVEPSVDLSVGRIDGLRQVNITNTIVRAFFDHTLLGREEELLYQPSVEWPELTYFYKNGSMVAN
ncbi:hypothetical protein ONZ43_g6080 [Nemania bipapillata]|uniref:Uncharacterized protein n=1 Tax=Nemania bipapillata TaxID=110536 RepID=A0ACC2I358_9PEZI|nr:hypothetical protein ONZ43_g6080 [Nemania bipapillata]